ncbi:MAG TPA: glycosyl hydrolase, partial [Dyadobacter sp.]|nr:glycosyl hydrolase [Dyadobacter sp.]
ILYVHRQTADTDIYWLDNRSNDANEAQISFRVTGKIPMLWNPETGKTSKVSYNISDGRTTIPLKFDSWQAYFIVFNGKATSSSYTVPTFSESEIADITGAWTVRFQPDLGAPAQAQLSALASLSENTDPGIKYFSGTATYENTLNAPTIQKNTQYWLDLGDVKNLAEVVVNGKNVGNIWKKPFRIEVTDALKQGSNSIQVKVTNTWVNRLIGDAQPGVVNKITYTTMPFYKADAPLLPSGLLGPVKLVAATPTK